MPFPSGGKQRQVQIDLNPLALQSKGLSAQDVGNAIAAQNQINPAGFVKIGATQYSVRLNNAPESIAALNDLLSPLENLRFACAAAGDAVDEDDCVQALQRIGLADQLDLPARVLSQGQRRRVGLARLFLSANRLLWVLDEPFTALDVRAVADLAATLSAHCDAGGMVMLTTHQDAPFSRPPDVLDVGVFAC